MSSLLFKSAWRFYVRQPWQSVLTIAGIGLGVAVYVGIDIANDSAARAFEISAEVVRGRTTHRLLPVGAALPETVYRDLLIGGKIDRAAPVVESTVRVGNAFGPRYTLLGIDPLKEGEFRDYSRFAFSTASAATRLLTESRAVLIPERLASEFELTIGAELTIWIEGRENTVEIAGLVADIEDAGGGSAPIIADISTAQVLLERPGTLDRIDLALSDEAVRRLEGELPAGTALVKSRSESDSLNEMMHAFRVNLTALGLLALVVGMFLIYSTMAFSIVQRRPVIGIYRAMGTDRGRVLRQILLEALCIGSIGTLIGLALGHLLSRGLVELVLRTIGDLYFSRNLESVPASPWIDVRGALLGLAVTAVAALGPAIEASRAEPADSLRRGALERKSRRQVRLGAWLAIPAFALAAVLLLIKPTSLPMAFAGLFFVLIAGAMLTPGFTVCLMKSIEPLLRKSFGLHGVMAARGVSASLSRTGVATAALTVAVAAVVGIALMIASFRQSFGSWVDSTLTADIYLTLDRRSSDNLEAIALGGERIAAIEALQGVRGLSFTRFVSLPTEFGTFGLRAQQPGPDGWGIDIVGDDDTQVLSRLGLSDGVVVSEPFAYRQGLETGDVLPLPTAEGVRDFSVAGIYRDYNSGGAAASISLDSYRRHWRDESLSGVGVHLADGFDESESIDRIASVLGLGSTAGFRSSATIRNVSLEIFDRTFRITEVLRLLAGSIAFLGVLSAALAIQLERSREIATLRSLGLSARALAAQTLTQTGLLGLAAGICAAPLGTLLASLLVHVINRRAFGWSMEFTVSASPLLEGLALAIGAAVLAGLYPAARMILRQPAAAVHDE